MSQSLDILYGMITQGCLEWHGNDITIALAYLENHMSKFHTTFSTYFTGGRGRVNF